MSRNVWKKLISARLCSPPAGVVQGKEPSVRQLALLHFRNTIVLSVKLEDALSRPRARVPPSVTQMLLILQVGRQVHSHRLVVCRRRWNGGGENLECWVGLFLNLSFYKAITNSITLKWCETWRFCLLPGCPWIPWCDRGVPEAWVFGSEGGLALSGHPRAVLWRWHGHPLLCSGWDFRRVDLKTNEMATLTPNPSQPFRKVLSLAQVGGATVQEPGGTIKELQHPFAADPSGWVWPRCQLCWQRWNSPPLCLRDYLMPRRTRTGLFWPGLRTRTVWPLLQPPVCGLPFQRYDTDVNVAE